MQEIALNEETNRESEYLGQQNKLVWGFTTEIDRHGKPYRVIYSRPATSDDIRQEKSMPVNQNENDDLTSPAFRALPAPERIRRLRRHADPFAPAWNHDPNSKPRYGQKSQPSKRD